MALSQEDVNIVIQEISVGVNACDNAAIAMIGWDLVVYFLEELEYVWKGRRNFITLLYAVTRYGILLELLLQLFFPTHSLRTIPRCV
ncbi:hypothetical protein QCA50_016070 [Cerrena zonata]|uniref:DUF6533 domain-containing protein n=1 Tax=Cerrena zonata TaxID=2478898 RepID=A0AAW0FN90_9APHY